MYIHFLFLLPICSLFASCHFRILTLGAYRELVGGGEDREQVGESPFLFPQLLSHPNLSTIPSESK